MPPSTTPPDPQKQRQAILRTLHTLLSHLKSANSTICPSQIPRALHAQSPGEYPDWRGMMDPVRQVVWEQVKEGRVEVTQGGEVRGWEDREGIKGPIRVRRGERWEGLVQHTQGGGEG